MKQIRQLRGARIYFLCLSLIVTFGAGTGVAETNSPVSPVPAAGVTRRSARVAKERRGRVVANLSTGLLVEYSNIRGDRYLKFEEFVEQDGHRFKVSREISYGRITGAIDIKSATGWSFFEAVVASGQQSAEGGTVIYIDVNDLKAVNNFSVGRGDDFLEYGHAIGDAYLQAVGEAIRNSVRAQDLVFQKGGDEFIVYLPTNDIKSVEIVMGRINREVANDPIANRIFLNELEQNYQDRYRQIEQATNASELPRGLDLTGIDRTLLQTHFEFIRRELLARQLDKIAKQAKIRPSVAIGAAILDPRDTPMSAFTRANQQGDLVKAAYKSMTGRPADVYSAVQLPGECRLLLESRYPTLLRPLLYGQKPSWTPSTHDSPVADHGGF